MSSARAWRTLRAFAAVAAESAIPAVDAAFVNVGADAFNVEVRLVDGAAAANTPTAVVLTYWRRTYNTVGTAVVDKVATITHTVSVADVDESVPRVLPDFGGSDLYVTVSFVAGTVPTFTGTVQCRTIN
jgi:hypothetical protein